MSRHPREVHDSPLRRPWTVRVWSTIHLPPPGHKDAQRVAALFGLQGGRSEILYEGFTLRVAPGEIVAVVGPSGAGKSVLLRHVARQVKACRWLQLEALAASPLPPVAVLGKGPLSPRLEMLSRCGLAEAPALLTPARHLSGGQLYRLAMARSLYRAARARRPVLLLADEFAATLDAATANGLCRQLRSLVRNPHSRVALLVATPRMDLLAALEPDQVVIKPLGQPARFLDRSLLPPPCNGPQPRRWPIEQGTIADYHALADFHYLAGPPAAHKRVYVIRPPKKWQEPASPSVAAVLVVSPPLANVRGRNRALPGRYNGQRRQALSRLNADIELISRVIVHPAYRGGGLAVRLVRHAIATAHTPLVETLAAMGNLHPLFERAGMTAYHLSPDVHTARLQSAADAVGLAAADLAAVAPVKALLAAGGASGAFLARELRRCIAKTLSPKQIARTQDPVAEVCRRTFRRYVYYLARRETVAIPGGHGNSPRP